ncbi:MAG: cryptochrome/photolyase family protein [bacterium]
MQHLIVLFGDQLSFDLPSLSHVPKESSLVFMCEVSQEARYVPHHKKKIAFIFSAMRHFKDALIQKGYQVLYRSIDDADNQGSFYKELCVLVQSHSFSSIIVTHPGEYRVLEMLQTLKKNISIPLTILEDTRFLCGLDEFNSFAAEKKQLRMEYFYRYMRKKHAILVTNNQPEGGQWNFDASNRQPLKDSVVIPHHTTFQADAISQEVIRLVNALFPDHFGDIAPFYFAVTHEQAKEVLKVFISERLPLFGRYQDAMKQEEAWLFHSHISFYLNCGLLNPKECIDAAVNAYYSGSAPLSSVEGFVRQLLGWREFIRGIYWLKMPNYQQLNALSATRPLPSFFWTGETDMNCLKQALQETKTYAYNHHIQRLMILGNFLLLTGIAPQYVQEWYLSVYADAYEWVELPNVMGMILYADNGLFASKPYAASGAYIHRMSNYCKSCRYNVKEHVGPTACPFNYLYWNFIHSNTNVLSKNPRMRMIYNSLSRQSSDKTSAMITQSTHFLDQLC